MTQIKFGFFKKPKILNKIKEKHSNMLKKKVLDEIQTIGYVHILKMSAFIRYKRQNRK